MNAAVYTDDVVEQQQISEALKKCGMEFLHPVRATPFADYTAFCRALSFSTFDLLVIAQNGNFGLELMDAVRQHSPDTPVFWFSDHDFAVRSYEYGVVWFGKKPIEQAIIHKAFKRLLDRPRKKKSHLTVND